MSVKRWFSTTLPRDGVVHHAAGTVPRGLPRCRAVQVDPIKPILEAAGTKRLKLNCDILLSNYYFQIQLAPLHPGRQRGPYHGQAVRVQSMEPVFKPPGTERLRL